MDIWLCGRFDTGTFLDWKISAQGYFDTVDDSGAHFRDTQPTYTLSQNVWSGHTACTDF